MVGTRDDIFLRAVSGLASRMVEVHVCEDPCGSPLEGEYLVHGEDFEEVDKTKEAWYTNLEEVVPEIDNSDELAKLREAAKGGEATPKEKEKKTRKESKKKGKKKKKKEAASSKKEKKPEREKAAKAKAEETSSSSSGSFAEKVGGKSLEAVLEGTGFDPDYKKRCKFLRKARKVSKKAKKKRKKESEGSSASQSSSSSSHGSDLASYGLFEPEKRIKAIYSGGPFPWYPLEHSSAA